MAHQIGFCFKSNVFSLNLIFFWWAKLNSNPDLSGASSKFPFLTWSGLNWTHPADQWPFPNVQTVLTFTSLTGCFIVPFLPLLLWFFPESAHSITLYLTFHLLFRSQRSTQPHQISVRKCQWFLIVSPRTATLWSTLSLSVFPPTYNFSLSSKVESANWLSRECLLRLLSQYAVWLWDLFRMVQSTLFVI